MILLANADHQTYKGDAMRRMFLLVWAVAIMGLLLGTKPNREERTWLVLFISTALVVLFFLFFSAIAQEREKSK